MPPRSKAKKTLPDHVLNVPLENLEYISEYTEDVAPSSWVLPNRFLFEKWMYQNFGVRALGNTGKNSRLFKHQRFIKDFLQYNSPYRGLLLYYGLGVGKTCAAIAASEVVQKHGLDITILLPASLRQNFLKEVHICGNNLYNLDQPWVFHSMDNVGNLQDVCQYIRLSPLVAKKNKGVWLPQHVNPIGDGISYDKMTDDQHRTFDAQIEDMMNQRYTFIAYNGVNTAYISELTKDGKNPFDNRIIIVDEVHNFVSRSLKSGSVTNRLYRLLLDARNCKLILLSGTPIINYPYELSFLINLAHGPLKQYEIMYTKKSTFVEDQVDAYLRLHKFIDRYNIRQDAQTIFISLVPEGFKLVDPTMGPEILRSKDGVMEEVMIASILEDLKALGVVLNGTRKISKPKETYLLPFDESEFDDVFIDYEKLEVKNSYMLSRRIQGIVSHYEVYSKDLYPTVHDMEIVHVDLTAEQMIVYQKVRVEEQKLEKNAKKNSVNNGIDNPFKNNGGVYRTFSRAACLFAFPSAIKRPYMSSLKKMTVDYDAYDDEDKVETDMANADIEKEKEKEKEKLTKKEVYQKILASARDELRKNGDEYLSIEGLNKYGPKMAAALTRINESPGSCLIYSQFRSNEGLGIMAMALIQNGYAELKIKRVGQQWVLDIEEQDYSKPKFIQFKSGEDATKILLDIFNSDFNKLPPSILQMLPSLHASKTASKRDMNLYGSLIKVIMITQSGSEGISLKNVRQVHILEPYWNNIRIQQVIGRAVRANSHIALPQKHRDVQVYMYVSKIKGEIPFVLRGDGMTSDEYILKIATRKSKIVDQLLLVMKQAAVDCPLYKGQHMHKKQLVKCITHPETKNKNAYSYVNDITLDDTDADMKMRFKEVTEKVPLSFINHKNVKYIYNKETNELFDNDHYRGTRELKKVGHVAVSDRGKKVVLYPS